LSRGGLFVDYGCVRLLYSDDGDLQEIYYHMNCRRWHDAERARLSRYLEPGDAAIDVGANMGFVAAILASIVGHEGRVFCFEPAKRPFKKLQKMVAANELDQVLSFNLGCGSEASSAVLHSVSASSGNSSIVNESDKGRLSERIEIVSLDSIAVLRERRIKLIKIDTEGYEPEVLAGGRELIQDHRPVIYSELGGGYLDSTQRAIEILRELDYAVDHVLDRDWQKVGRGADFAFLPRDSD